MESALNSKPSINGSLRKSSLKENHINGKHDQNNSKLIIKEISNANGTDKTQNGTITLFEEWEEFTRVSKFPKNLLKSKNMRILQMILEEVNDAGGFVEAISKQYFDENYHRLLFTSAKELIEFYEVFILPFEFSRKSNDVSNSFKPKLLLKCKILSFSEFEGLRENIIKFRKCFDKDIVIIRGFCQGYGIDEQAFHPEAIESLHGSELIDIRSQNKNFTGIHLGRMNMQASKMKLKDYVEYMKNSQLVNINPSGDRIIKFAVNVDVGQWQDVTNQLQKVPPEIMCNSKFDALQYSRNHILGVTMPQMYLKINGCWTGGHQENVNLRAININHGPADCVWYSIDISEATRLRDALIQNHKFDIYNNEGLWFLTIEECHSYGIPVTRVIQRPGDCVVLAPGAIHWVKSLGVTINTAWNIASKELFQFESMYARFKENRKIKYNNLIPMKTLFLDYLIQELSIINEKLKSFLIDKSIEFIREEALKIISINNNFEYRSQFPTENVNFFFI